MYLSRVTTLERGATFTLDQQSSGFVACHSRLDQLQIVREDLLQDLQVLEADLQESPVETGVHLLECPKHKAALVDAFFHLKLHHVGFVEVHVVWLHKLSLLDMSELLAIEIGCSTEVRAEVCQGQQHNAGLRAVVVVYLVM
jgi:hypothetical protein